MKSYPKSSSALALAAALGLGLATTASASVPLAGKALEVYGKFHLSLDLGDPDTPTGSSSLSLSSNLSRLGFKGEHQINPNLGLLWQLEQEIKPDEASGNFATRNSYVGLTGRNGTVLFGHHDTPFKLVGTNWGLFDATVGDRRAILGASATAGNQMNERAKNAILYKNKFQQIDFMAMYSTDPKDSAPGQLDNDTYDLISLSGVYREGPLEIAVAYEDWADFVPGGAAQSVDGLRISAKQKIATGTLGLIYETLGSSAIATLDRDAMGINYEHLQGDITFKVQFLTVDSYTGTGSTGATSLAFGVNRRLDKQTEVYAAYMMVRNDAGAAFQGTDGGHGDEITTTAGGDPTALSAGLIYSF